MAKILILANNDSGLYKFRKELIEELSIENDVYISLPGGDNIPRLKELGCTFIETPIDRRGINPIADFKLFMKYVKVLKEVKPDIVLTYTIKPNVYGGIASSLLKKPYIANVTGLGTAVENGGVIQKITLVMYKYGLKKAACVFFQNESNREFFIGKRIVGKNNRLIPGSGVNLKDYKLQNYPSSDKGIKFLFIGRIMKAKGIDELLAAAEKIKTMHQNTSFDLIGDIEEDFSIKLKEYTEKKIINYHGQQDSVIPFIRDTHATILPSYHEGTANVLLESAASGRPVIGTAIPGCIETYNEGISGFGCKVRNSESLVQAISKFINLSHIRKEEMGIKGREKMELEFNRNIIISAYLEEIRKAQEENRNGFIR
ncbi:glycosyltransferase [Planococcus antarcticus DSM 14505]|uniref:Glycosyltransferase n=1 Tax=Planococcus antarcticus DSM 14505 TaxID=1185653 RepID=A0AA87IJ75_9BACL|nr:glycosyltransferase family 4 protein [Planococcus antarcticus]EIM05710.1 glycosyltransferase [Planococcus antarcticus DSM 14505]